MQCTTPGIASPDIARLDIVARELEAISERLNAVAQLARGLSAATDWHARAATAFHDAASAWSGDVSGLGCLADEAQAAAWRARWVAVWNAQRGCA